MSTTGASSIRKSRTEFTGPSLVKVTPDTIGDKQMDKNRDEIDEDKKLKIKRDCEQQMETSFKEHLKDIRTADLERQKNMDSIIKDYEIQTQRVSQTSSWVFPGYKKDKPLQQLPIETYFLSKSSLERNYYDAKIEHSKNMYRIRALYTLNTFENKMKELDILSKGKIDLELQTNTRRREKTTFPGQHEQNTQFSEDDLPLLNNNSGGRQNEEHKNRSEEMASRSQDKQNTAILDNIYTELNTFYYGGDGVCIVLLGKAGTGKSATGNSILLRQAFQENAETAVTEAHISVAYTKIQGKEVCVIDAPSMNDISTFDHNCIDRFRKTFEGVVLKYSSIHIALLIVLKYGERFSKEDRGALQIVKSIFGSSMLSECGICLFTHGDIFQKSKEDFSLWCDTQAVEVKDLGELFKACGNRCTLFTNQIDYQDNSFREEQRNDLFEIIIKLKNYKVAEVLQSIKLTENLAVEPLLPFYEKEIENFVKNVKIKMSDASRDILPTLKSVIDKKIIEVKQLGYDQSTTDKLIEPFKEVDVSINLTIMNNLLSQNVTQLKSTSEISKGAIIK